MQYNIYLSLVIYLISNVLIGQSAPSLPVSAEYEAALKAGSRTLEGTPGAKYFQNHASYQLSATVNPVDRSIEGNGRIIYTNSSPDELDQIVLRLYQNMYKADAVHDLGLKESEYTDGMELKRLLVNGVPTPISPEGTSDETGAAAYVNGTNLHIRLSEPLAAGDKITLEIDWAFTITDGYTVRMGTYGEHAYFVAYWYPQVAVYDDIYGWDTLQYNGLVEFYNDFNDYDVSISVPDDLVVWATGELQNPESLLEAEFLTRYQLAKTVDTVVQIVSRADYQAGKRITRAGGTNTWRFLSKGVPDVAFALADYYYWDATSIQLEGHTQRTLVQACYKPEAKDFVAVAAFSREIIEDLSTEVPGIPYPYPVMTAFNGETRGFGGGMEFPMMINDGTCFSLSQTFDLTYHEIAHTYFPFYMGINERRFAWMDEGWASFLPSDLVKEKGYAGVPMRSNVSMYEVVAGSRRQSSLMTESYTQNQGAYYPAAYYHPATAYHMLRLELGDELFLKALQTYMSRWAGKHPQPYDFFFTFNEVVGEDLSWFWKPWFFETGRPDLALKVRQIKGKKVDLIIQNKGDLPIPIRLQVELKSGQVETLFFPAAYWKDGAKEMNIQEKFSGKVVSVELGGADIPDKSSRNNKWELKKSK